MMKITICANMETLGQQLSDCAPETLGDEAWSKLWNDGMLYWFPEYTMRDEVEEILAGEQVVFSCMGALSEDMED